MKLVQIFSDDLESAPIARLKTKIGWVRIEALAANGSEQPNVSMAALGSNDGKAGAYRMWVDRRGQLRISNLTDHWKTRSVIAKLDIPF